MKKIIIAMVLLLLVLSGCGAAPTEEPVEEIPSEVIEEPVEEPTEPEKPAVIERKMPSSEELLELLKYQVYLYEKGNYGFPLDPEGEDYVSWMFAAAYSDEIGATEDDSTRRQPLIRLMYDRWLGIYYPDYFSYVSPAETFLEIDIKTYEITESEVTLVVSRVRDGIDYLDCKYVFVREEADEELLKSEAEPLTLGGYYWRYESVTPIDEKGNYEVVTISTPEELMDFCDRVNEHDPAAVNGKFVLGNDIDMTGFDLSPIGRRYDKKIFDSPLIYARSCYGFNGEFDGAGHTISGIGVNYPENIYDPQSAGFFGVIGPFAYVHDLTVSGSVTNANPSDTGGFAGTICGGAKVENCRFEGTVEGIQYVGGFCGNVSGDNSGGVTSVPAMVKNCSSDAVITASYTCGGFAGYISSPLSDCEATGTLNIVNKGQRPNIIGGFCGGLLCDIKNCRSAVNINYEVKTPDWMGNFIGEVIWEVKIEDCTIDPDNLHDGWRLIGIRHYKNCVVDIVKDDWYNGLVSDSSGEVSSGVVIKVYD